MQPDPDIEPLLVVGIGSPYGDDRLGWLVIDNLETLCAPLVRTGHIRLLRLDRPTTELLSHITPYRRAILIDALALPGTRDLQVFSVHSLPASPTPSSSHGFGLADTLQLGQTLGLLPEQVEIYGIPMLELPTAQDFDTPSIDLTPHAKQTARLIAQRLTGYCQRTPGSQSLAHTKKPRQA